MLRAPLELSTHATFASEGEATRSEGNGALITCSRENLSCALDEAQSNATKAQTTATSNNFFTRWTPLRLGRCGEVRGDYKSEVRNAKNFVARHLVIIATL